MPRDKGEIVGKPGAENSREELWHAPLNYETPSDSAKAEPWPLCPHPWSLPGFSPLIGTHEDLATSKCFWFPGLIFLPSTSPS